MEVHEVPPGDAGVRAFLEHHNADRAARRGGVVDSTARPALVVYAADGTVAGVLTYDIVGPECEVVTLHAASRWGGVSRS